MPKKRGRRPTGKAAQSVARMPDEMLASVDTWAARNKTTRSEAIRRLVELGLTVRGAKAKPTSAARADRARELASTTIDKMTESSPSSDEKSSRKRRLIKGPEEFQGVRVDRTKK